MDENTTHETYAKMMRRISKSDTCIYGAAPATNISVNKPCVVAFGGEHTKTIKDANYYASMLIRLLGYYGIKGVDVYSVYYDFNVQDRKSERENMFIKARSKMLQQGKIQPVDTNYVQDMYNMVIHPRIVGDDNAKLSDIDALQNIRNVIIFDHSHGAVPVREFQEIMVADMHKYGYEQQVIVNIMRNLLVIQHAPVAPLEKSKFTTVSFMSANDTQANYRNKFSEYVSENEADLPPSYFPLGNVFAVREFTHQSIAEHQIIGLVPTDNQDMLTPDGAIIMAAERNAIINGIDAVLRGAPIPTTRDLIAPVLPTDIVRPDFDTLATNGEFFMRIMRSDLRAARNANAR